MIIPEKLIDEVISALNQIPNTKYRSDRFEDTYELVAELQKEKKEWQQTS